MTSSVFFASGDVGGTRALLPVLKAAYSGNYDCHYLFDGHIINENDLPTIAFHCIEPTDVENQAIATLHSIKPSLLVFTTSVTNTNALLFAKAASRLCIPTIHLLDNWTNYSSRLTLPNGETYLPDLYAVMDKYSYNEAIKSGIPEDILRITGTPALSNIGSVRKTELSESSKYIFISEPVDQDQGEVLSATNSRGYTQYTVLSELIRIINMFPASITLDIFPHPREDVLKLSNFWISSKRDITGKIVPEECKNDVMASCTGVIGMSSILLYEAWLREFPVLSLQPGLAQPHLRFVTTKTGLTSIVNQNEIEHKVSNWFSNTEHYEPAPSIFAEREQHTEASRNIISLFNIWLR